MKRRKLSMLLLLIILELTIGLVILESFIPESNKICGQTVERNLNIDVYTDLIDLTPSSTTLEIGTCLSLTITKQSSSSEYIVSSNYIISARTSEGYFINIVDGQINSQVSSMTVVFDPPERHSTFDIAFRSLDSTNISVFSVQIGNGRQYYNFLYILICLMLFMMTYTGFIIYSKYRQKKEKTVIIYRPNSEPISVTPQTYENTLRVLSQLTPDIQVQLSRIAELAESKKHETEGIIIDLLKHHSELGEYKILEQVFIRSLPIKIEDNVNIKDTQIHSMIENRRCCLLYGRLGDQYCNICGRVIPDEYLLSD